jgi:hypothetical protein
MFIRLRPPKKSPGRNKKRVELRPPTAAVDLQLRPVPCGVPTPRHLQLWPEAAPTPPRWTPNPGASRAPVVAARRAPTSAPPAPAVAAAHLDTCISGRAPHLCVAPSLEPRPRRSRVVGGLQGAASSDQSTAVFVSARARFARVHRPPRAEVQHRSLLFPFSLRLCS